MNRKFKLNGHKLKAAEVNLVGADSSKIELTYLSFNEIKRSKEYIINWISKCPIRGKEKIIIRFNPTNFAMCPMTDRNSRFYKGNIFVAQIATRNLKFWIISIFLIMGLFTENNTSGLD